MHCPDFRGTMLEIYVSYRFGMVCFGVVHFAATEAQELPLSTSLSILYFSMIDFEVIFLS